MPVLLPSVYAYPYTTPFISNANCDCETFTDSQTYTDSKASPHPTTAPLNSTMKKKRTAQFGSLSLQLVFCSAAVCSMITGTLLAFFHSEAPAKASHPAAAGLTFAERVAYQRAIEEVYWRHRIWPEERHDPKPSLDAVMSQAQIERKSIDYLRNSQALEDYSQRPITPAVAG